MGALFSVFVSAVAGLVLRPLPSGAWALVCLTFTVASGILPFQAAFQAFQPEMMRAVTKGVLHANTGARYKSRLHQHVQSLT